MGKIDREYEARMNGCLYAIKQIEQYNAEGKDGIAEFKQEMKRRGYSKLDISCSEKIMTDMLNVIRANVTVCFLWALHESEGFRATRLKRIYKAYDKAVTDAFCLDYMLEHYVTMADYAVYLNEHYNLGLNPNFIQATEDSFDESQYRYNKQDWIKGVINQLRIWGYEEAAQRFEDKLKKETGYISKNE